MITLRGFVALKASTLVGLHLGQSGLKQWPGTLCKHIHVLLMSTKMYLENKTIVFTVLKKDNYSVALTISVMYVIFTFSEIYSC